MQAEHKRSALNRLKTVRGHLDAVISMVDDERYCPDIMKQVSHDLFDWVRKDKFMIGQEEYSEISQGAGVRPFFADSVAISNSMSASIGSGMKSIGDKFEWDLFYLPNSDDGKLAITRAGGHGNNITSASKVKDEAWEQIKFMGTTPGMKHWVQAFQPSAYRKDPSLRAAYEALGGVEHIRLVFGTLEDRGGYGDHLRFHNEGEVRNMFTNELDLLYNEPYETAATKLDETMARVEQKMNDAVDYGDELPFPDMAFPWPPPKPVV